MTTIRETGRNTLRKELEALACQDYKKFSAGLIPTLNEKNVMLGIRIPQLRKMAKEISKKENWREFLDGYNKNKDELSIENEPGRIVLGGSDNVKYPYYEEIMIEGMVINLAKMSITERLERIRIFVPKIDNWAICDIFCANEKWVKDNRAVIWEFLQPYLKSDKEFEIRYGVIMLLSAFLDNEYIDRVLEALDVIPCVRLENKKLPVEKRKKGGPIIENYYVEMAVAWCLATALAKCREQTIAYLKRSSLSKSVLKRAAQKMRESYRISQEDKMYVTNLEQARLAEREPGR